MIEKELLLIGLMINLLGSFCYPNTNLIESTIFIQAKKDNIFCITARQLPDDDAPSKSPYKPRPTTDIYMSNATGTTGPTASGTASPSPSPEA